MLPSAENGIASHADGGGILYSAGKMLLKCYKINNDVMLKLCYDECVRVDNYILKKGLLTHYEKKDNSHSRGAGTDFNRGAGRIWRKDTGQVYLQ